MNYLKIPVGGFEWCVCVSVYACGDKGGLLSFNMNRCWILHMCVLRAYKACAFTLSAYKINVNFSFIQRDSLQLFSAVLYG